MATKPTTETILPDAIVTPTPAEAIKAETRSQMQGYKRPKPKTIDLVTFSVEFADQEITLPCFPQLPVATQRKLTTGNVEALRAFIEKHGSQELAYFLFDDEESEVDQRELMEFMDIWGKASGADLGK